MASSPPLTSPSPAMVPAPMDSSALRSCVKCHRRMSSLKYDLHTICSQCRYVVCSVAARCDECRNWSNEVMSDYLKHNKALATKSWKKPVTSASSSSVIPLAVASSPLLGSPSRLPTVSDNTKIRDTILSVLHALLQDSLDVNPLSFLAPSLVPDSAPKKGRLLVETAACSPIRWEA